MRLLLCTPCVFIDAQAQAKLLVSSCGETDHSESEQSKGYGENLFVCASTGTETCYTPEEAMASLCEMMATRTTIEVARFRLTGFLSINRGNYLVAHFVSLGIVFRYHLGHGTVP